MPYNSQLDAPITLTGLFPSDSDDGDDNDDENDTTRDEDASSKNTFEIQNLQLHNVLIHIRQYDFHSHNANMVWPGTFNLADYLLATIPIETTITTTTTKITETPENVQKEKYVHEWGNMLELGTATGLLAIRLCYASRVHDPHRSRQQQLLHKNFVRNMNNHNNNKNQEHHDKLENEFDNDDDTTTTNRRITNDDDDDDDYCCSTIVTSDVQDHENQIQTNLFYNYQLNGVGVDVEDTTTTITPNETNMDDPSKTIQQQRQSYCPPLHVPHTWGSGWKQSYHEAIQQQQQNNNNNNNRHGGRIRFDTIVASDILLYVSAYGDLVETLVEIFDDDKNDDHNDNDNEDKNDTIPIPYEKKFIMSWNRRMKESNEFFIRMKDAGFHCHHEGKCVYTFTRP